MNWVKIAFDRTGGHWLFWASAIYLCVGLYCGIYYKEIPTPLIQACWIFAIGLPLYFPPLGRWLNMDINWDKIMFDIFKKRTAKEFLEQANETYIVPEKEEAKEKPATTYYRLGLTDNNRVSFSMGYSEITMTADGVDNLVKQLELFKSQLQTETTEEKQ